METDQADCDDYEWEKEMEEFERTKAGVKGLVDSGIQKVPRFFISPPEAEPSDMKQGLQFQIPVIDLQGVESCGARRKEVTDEIRRASQTWGFFQMVNHGVPVSVMDAILDGTRRFHEQPTEAKMDLYSSDGRPNVRFYSINGHLKKGDVASWRDAFACSFMNGVLDPQSIPPICRNEITDYMKYMRNLRDILSQLISEALGVSRDLLEEIECIKSEYLTCLYYPASPEPDKTFGTIKHSDPTTLTVLVQDNCGGLQIHHQGHWVDVPPIQGALIANIGDLLQLITNDEFVSVEHRVVARETGSRVSAACFFYPSAHCMMKPYGPIKELLNQDHPHPIYTQVTYIDFVTHYQKISVRPAPHSALAHFKLH